MVSRHVETGIKLQGGVDSGLFFISSVTCPHSTLLALKFPKRHELLELIIPR